MLSALILLLCLIPYPSQPDWESDDDDYATGGALVDIDRDGDLDFLTGNGNDMAQDPNRVYYNTGIALEIVASWSSSDVGYNAHISVGDINHDGYPELAVANYGDPYAPQYDKFYLNQAGVLQSSSSWRPHDLDNSFACAFGDLDGDGDLDLAVACGESYSDSLQSAKVYVNNGGVLDTVATWESNIQSYFYDVAWVDFDSDGDLDLALGAENRQNLLYENTGGALGFSPFWESANSLGTLKLAFGDVDGDGDLDMACANNAQLGGISNCEIYLNNGGGYLPTPSWSSQAMDYYSCVAFGDVDRDGDLDLAAGGWWEPVAVFENTGGTFPSTPSWSWIPANATNLVCENISFGDVDNTWPSAVTDEAHLVSPDSRVFYLGNRWLKDVSRVRLTTGDLDDSLYCYSYADGWVSVAPVVTVPETVWVDYTYSRDLDLVVTNWHASRGNFLFLNTSGSGIAAADDPTARADIWFASPVRSRLVVGNGQQDIVVAVYDAMGRFVGRGAAGSVGPLRPGVYFVQAFSRDCLLGTGKVVVLD